MQPDETAPWIALVCSAEWLLHDVQNESFAEQLRERVRLYADGGQPLNFHLVSQPAWLDTLFPEEAKRIGRPAVALVCPDKDWMTYVVVGVVMCGGLYAYTPNTIPNPMHYIPTGLCKYDLIV